MQRSNSNGREPELNDIDFSSFENTKFAWEQATFSEADIEDPRIRLLFKLENPTFLPETSGPRWDFSGHPESKATKSEWAKALEAAPKSVTGDVSLDLELVKHLSPFKAFEMHINENAQVARALKDKKLLPDSSHIGAMVLHSNCSDFMHEVRNCAYLIHEIDFSIFR